MSFNYWIKNATETRCEMFGSDDTYTFNRLYQDYKPRFTHFAKTYVDDWDTAEDIVIDSLVYYWERRQELKHGANIPGYILTVIKNRCLNHLQRERTRREVESYLAEREDWELNLRIATLEACNPERLFSDEVQAIINKTLDSLPPLTREIFLRSKDENQSHKEIAAALGISIKAVEYHITKTLKVLRTSLHDYFPLLLLGCYWGKPFL